MGCLLERGCAIVGGALDAKESVWYEWSVVARLLSAFHSFGCIGKERMRKTEDSHDDDCMVAYVKINTVYSIECAIYLN